MRARSKAILRPRVEQPSFSAEEAAFHEEAIRQAHLRTLLPHFKRCKTERERDSFNQIVSKDDVAELRRMADTKG